MSLLIKKRSTIQKQSAHMVLLWLRYMSTSLQTQQEHSIVACSWSHNGMCPTSFKISSCLSFGLLAVRWTSQFIRTVKEKKDWITLCAPFYWMCLMFDDFWADCILKHFAYFAFVLWKLLMQYVKRRIDEWMDQTRHTVKISLHTQWEI